MIDIKKAEEEFKKYTSKYDMSNSHIERKVRHTFRVEKICEELAVLLKMSKEEIKLSKLIGILHDIARFEQYTIYKTFSDIHSIDHGDFAVEILKEDSYIRKYIETDRYDKIIKKAIYNHNKYSIEENLSKEERLYCNIIRDADKLDIMYQGTFESWKDNIGEIEEQLVSLNVLEQFKLEHIIDKKYINCDIDKVVVILAFIYDLNFQESYKIIKENSYINKIIDRFKLKKEETRNQMEEIRKLANDYVEKQIKDN